MDTIERQNVMNDYLNNTINNAIQYLTAFEDALKLAAIQNDGIIDKDEEKLIRKATDLTEKYMKDLKKLNR